VIAQRQCASMGHELGGAYAGKRDAHSTNTPFLHLPLNAQCRSRREGGEMLPSLLICARHRTTLTERQCASHEESLMKLGDARQVYHLRMVRTPLRPSQVSPKSDWSIVVILPQPAPLFVRVWPFAPPAAGSLFHITLNVGLVHAASTDSLCDPSACGGSAPTNATLSCHPGRWYRGRQDPGDTSQTMPHGVEVGGVVDRAPSHMGPVMCISFPFPFVRQIRRVRLIAHQIQVAGCSSGWG